jgi:hypothetical protein
MLEQALRSREYRLCKKVTAPLTILLIIVMIDFCRYLVLRDSDGKSQREEMV